MLRGEAQYALDDKGRVVIPPKFRAAMGDRVIVTRWTGPWLAAFSSTAWQSLEEKLRTLPLSQHEARRYVLSAAEDCELDRQGRIYLPPHLREHAGITRSVTIIGVGSNLELWSTPRWRGWLQKLRKAPDELAQQLGALQL